MVNPFENIYLTKEVEDQLEKELLESMEDYEIQADEWANRKKDKQTNAQTELCTIMLLSSMFVCVICIHRQTDKHTT